MLIPQSGWATQKFKLFNSKKITAYFILFANYIFAIFWHIISKLVCLWVGQAHDRLMKMSLYISMAYSRNIEF